MRASAGGGLDDGFFLRLLFGLVVLAFLSTVYVAVTLFATRDPSTVSDVGRFWLAVALALTPYLYRRYLDGFRATVTDWLAIAGVDDGRDRGTPSLVVHSLALLALVPGTLGVVCFYRMGDARYLHPADADPVSIASTLGVEHVFGLGFWSFLALFFVGWLLVAAAWVVEGLAFGG